LVNLFQPSVGELELSAISEVLSSGWLGTGERTAAFQREFAEYLRNPGGEFLAVTSCTEGLFQAVAALELESDEEVILPTISFVGAANAVRSAGARIVLCDVDPVTLNPTLEHVEAALTPATRAVLILHYGGAPGSVAEISWLTHRRGLTLIEDAACGLGSFAGERACGTLGDIGVWSFDSMKTITTGDGGMIWLRDSDVAARVFDAVRLGEGASGFARRAETSRWWEIEPRSPGRRAAMNDLSAAIGRVQLQRLPEFLTRRHQIAARYDAGLGDVQWVRLPPPLGEDEARTFYWVQVAQGMRDRLAEHLLAQKIYTSFRYWPLHKTRLYGCELPFPGADHAAASTLMLPLHQGLTRADVEKVLLAIRSFDA
jgi:dTDP-4-amino-4,6-dideoxygalactose transaminase